MSISKNAPFLPDVIHLPSKDLKTKKAQCNNLHNMWTSVTATSMNLMCRWQLTRWNWASTAARLIHRFFEHLDVAPYDEWGSRKERLVNTSEWENVSESKSGTFEADRRGGESENDVRAAVKVKGWNEDVRMNSEEGGKEDGEETEGGFTLPCSSFLHS